MRERPSLYADFLDIGIWLLTCTLLILTTKEFNSVSYNAIRKQSMLLSFLKVESASTRRPPVLEMQVIEDVQIYSELRCESPEPLGTPCRTIPLNARFLLY